MITNGKCIFQIGIHTLFFQQQEIKRALHQSTLGLFLRVWEEVIDICIDYLRDITSMPFKNMLALFAYKEY